MKKQNNKIMSLVLLLLATFSLAMRAADKSDIVYDYCWLGYNGAVVCEDITGTRFVFSSLVDAVADAKAYIMLGDKVLAESSSVKSDIIWDNSGTNVNVAFTSPIRLAKGHTYRIVLPAGAVCSHTDHSVLSEEVVQEFVVPESLVGTNSQLHDGCSLPWVQTGGFDFGAAEAEKVGNPKMKLYKGSELLGEVEISLARNGAALNQHSYINFIFDKRILLENGVRYSLVLPKGSIRSKVRNDIVNDEIRIGVTGMDYKMPELGEANASGIVPNECAFSLYGIFMYADIFPKEGTPKMYDLPMYADISEASVLFDSQVDVKEGAKIYVMLGDDVMATSSKVMVETGSYPYVVASFDAPVRLPKGHTYKLVIPAGVVCSSSDPTQVAGRIAYDFVVPDDFSGSFTINSEISDGCTLASIRTGGAKFGAIETVSVDGAKVYLYKGEDLAASCDAVGKYDYDLGYMSFDFGRTIELEKDGHYQLVLPAGSLCTSKREDIVNKEMRINIYGPKSGTGVEGVASDAVSVSCRDGILRIRNVQQGQLVEVFSCEGRLVQRAKAAQTSLEIPLHGKGCYVVRVGGKTMKGVLN